MIAFALVLLGLLALCLACPTHFQQSFARPPRAAQCMALRVAGMLALLAAAWKNAADAGLEQGLVAWACMLAAAGIPLILAHGWLHQRGARRQS